MKFNVSINGYFHLSENELKGCSQQEIDDFIQGCIKATRDLLLSEVEDTDMAEFHVKITSE